MEVADFLKDIYEYNHHFNQKLIGLFENSKNELPEKCLKLLSHTINAHTIWNCRIQGKIPETGVWELHALDKLRKSENEEYQVSIEILKVRPLDEKIQYQNSKGLEFTNSIYEILFHVANHSNYHRAQIATLVKDSGVEPLVTDYIFYKR